MADYYICGHCRYVASTYDEFKVHTTKKGKVCWGRACPPNKIDEPVKDASAENLHKRLWGDHGSHKKTGKPIKYLPTGFIKKGEYLTRSQMFVLGARIYSSPFDFINAEVNDSKIKIKQAIVTLAFSAVLLALVVMEMIYIATHPISCSSSHSSSKHYTEHQKSVQREAYNLGKVWDSMKNS